MAESANTFANLSPLFKESYASGPMATHKNPGSESNIYSDKIQKIMQKPNSSKQYFSHIKKYLKKSKKR